MSSSSVVSDSIRRILVTGADGFIGKNLVTRLGELQGYSVSRFVRSSTLSELNEAISQADAVIHLAGENRPQDPLAFETVNVGLTQAVCDAVRKHGEVTGKHVNVVLASSAQAETANPYGLSKLAAESAVRKLSDEIRNPSVVFRLPGVFGKWCKPNYNSVVATFCYNLARGLPIQINDPTAELRLVYVDDVVEALIAASQAAGPGCSEQSVQPEYRCTLGDLAAQIRSFDDCRASLQVDRVGTGLTRALYATYVSYLPIERFSYRVQKHADPRGVFVEMLKTADSGQFSYFTAGPGITRGGHYHHTKTEKFLVIQGQALFRFRHLITNEVVELKTEGGTPQIVDTIPGWVHDITNVGTSDMIVMLWANENFDRARPDTVACAMHA